jgi:hypothetical protein
MIYIYAVKLSGGASHEHIAAVRWKNPDTGKTGQNGRTEMVGWIRDEDGKAYVCGNSHLARVGVVDATVPYLRTHADGVWSDNLLALPRFS